MWRPGSKLAHPFNPELGPGEVTEVDGRFLVVWFPEVEREMRLAAEGSGLAPLELAPGPHEITLSHPRYGEVRRQLVLAPGEERTLRHRFEGAPRP